MICGNYMIFSESINSYWSPATLIWSPSLTCIYGYSAELSHCNRDQRAGPALRAYHQLLTKQVCRHTSPSPSPWPIFTHSFKTQIRRYLCKLPQVTSDATSCCLQGIYKALFTAGLHHTTTAP